MESSGANVVYPLDVPEAGILKFEDQSLHTIACALGLPSPSSPITLTAVDRLRIPGESQRLHLQFRTRPDAHEPPGYRRMERVTRKQSSARA